MSGPLRSDAGGGSRGPAEAAETDGTAAFLRGLTIGVLVGGAIAGSAIWHRLRERTTLGRPKAG